jgi:hypothetical protein
VHGLAVVTGQPFLGLARGAGRRLLLSAALAGAAAVAGARCGGSTAVTSVAGPTGVRCGTTLAIQPATVPHDGGSIEVSITSTRDCTWTASTDASWIQLTATSGQGSGTVAGTVTRNEQPAARSGAIVVNDQRLAVSQQPRPCSYELRPSRVQVGRQGGRSSVEVATLAGCTWTASSDAQWVRVAATTGSGGGTIELEVSSNDGDAREASIVVADQRVVVEQEASLPPCGLSISPGSQSFEGRGGEGRFRVDAQQGCEWSASAGASWISVGRQGSGPGEVGYTVHTNPTASDRSGSVTVSGSGQSATHTVRQGPGPRPCTFTLSSSSQNFPAGGGDGLFHVNAEAACLWTASSSDSWVIVRGSGPYGTGSADVAYRVLPNTSGTPRSTRITVGNQTHTVNQAAAASISSR